MDPFRLVISLCWATFAVTWVVAALFVKRTVEGSLGWARIVALVVLVAVYVVVRPLPSLRRELWSLTPGTGTIAALLTLAGLAIAIWARVVLGGNWSGTIAFKQDHELIQRGPYAWVRHPIYTGLLLMTLGTAVESTRLAAFIFLGVLFVLLALKARAEERLMMRHFPEAYAQYRRRVRALIPGVW